MDKPLPPALQPTAADRIAAVLRGLGSSIDILQPGAGTIFAELVGVIIPGLREERLAEYVARWARRTSELAQGMAHHQDRIASVEERIDELRAVIDALKMRPVEVALFEDGARAAVRSLSTDRIERIAVLVANGMFDEGTNAVHARAILEIVDQLSDEEIVVLCSYTDPYLFDPQWRALHAATLRPSYALMLSDEGGLSSWTPEAYEATDIEQARETKLVRLGLLKRPLEIENDANLAMVNQQPISNSLKEGGLEITRLGKRVLRDLGLIDRV